MKGSIAVAVSSLLAGAAQAQSGVVQWGIQKRQAPEDTNRLRRRAGNPVAETISNNQQQGGYFADCKVGTPAQDLTLQLDTGSSDIWVPASDASICRQSKQGGCSLGSFNQDKSTTFDDVGPNEFDISYVDGSSSQGDYFTDVFQIGGASLTNMTMGLGSQTDIPFGLVGVGYALNEAIIGDSQSTSSEYPNLPVNMVNEGLINTVAYSLWLNDLDSSSGSILFGGIDTAKYQGDLTRIQIYPDQSGAFSAFMVAMTSLTASSSSGSDTLTSTSFPIPVVLDSGTTLTYLPQDLAEEVWTECGAVYDPQSQIAVIPCGMSSSSGVFSFGFGGPDGPRINVTMSELVLNPGGQPTQFTSGAFAGQDVCEFGIQNLSSSQSSYLLGDTFLRSAYVVYDLVNNEVGLAATDFNSTDSNVVAFPSSSATIPSATLAPDQTAATDVPSFTKPAYAASAGFTNSASTGSSHNAAPGMPEAFSLAQLSVVGIAMMLTMTGSGLFFLI